MGTGSREGQASLEPVRMKETCRICGRELCGTQRRWIFHPSARVNLQAVLSHALGRELSRGLGGGAARGEFACSKCAFMLERVYRFDTVIARVEALSLSRVHKLLLEKERLRRCIGGLYRRNNSHEEAGPGGSDQDRDQDQEQHRDRDQDQDARYLDMVQDDLAYCVYESWADHRGEALGASHRGEGEEPRRCRGCAALRVADSDYEAVCKVPRRAARRSTSCGPPTPRCATATLGGQEITDTLGDEDPETTTTILGGQGPEITDTLGDEDPETTTTILGGQGPEITVTMGDEDPETTTTLLGGQGPETTTILGAQDPETTTTLESSDKTLCGGSTPSPASSVESLDTALDVIGGPPGEGAGLEVGLRLLRSCRYRPLRPLRNSRLPLPLPADRRPQALPRWTSRAAPEQQQQLQVELQEMEEQWLDDYIQWEPISCQKGPIRDQLSVCESAALLAKIRDSESRNQELQQRLAHTELQLRSAQDEAQQQQRDLQNLSNTLSSKEAQAAELCAVIEEQNETLSSLKPLQVCGAETPRGHSELLALQAALFQSQLELQAGQRVQRQAERTHGDLRGALQRLEDDLQGALEQRRETERHNQELQQALQKARASLQQREEQLQRGEQAQQRRSEELEARVRALQASLLSKDQLIQDWELLELEEPQVNRDSLLQKLRQRIRERDRALERAVDDKFRCLEEREEEQRQLHLLLRDKERDLERQRCVLANNQETIASLELLLRGRSLELQQVREGVQQQQQLQQQVEGRQRSFSREHHALIGQLQGALQASIQEAQELRSALLAAVQSAPGNVLEELKSRLQLKDRLFQGVLSDRARQAQEHQEQVEELLRTISSRTKYIQDSAARLGEVMSEQTTRVQELRRQLSSTGGSGGSGGPDQALELQTLQEELQLVLRREKENQEVQSRKLQLKEEMILELQRLLVEPSALPLVERLSQEVQELRESLVQPGRGSSEVLDLVQDQQDQVGDPAYHQQPEFGGGHQRSMEQYQ